MLSIDHLLTRACTITRRTWDGPANEFGDPTPQETTIDALCHLQPQQTSEDTDAGTVVSSGWVLWLPAGTDVNAADTIDVAGAGTFEVAGEPFPWTDPRGVERHVQVNVERAAGTDEGIGS